MVITTCDIQLLSNYQKSAKTFDFDFFLYENWFSQLADPFSSGYNAF